MRIKTIAAGLLSMVLLMVTTGCAEIQTQAPVGAAPDQDEAESVAQAQDIETADETPVTITYYTWVQSSDGAYPLNMIEGFEKKYPWITVDLQIGSNTGGEYSETQAIKLLAGDGIDVTTIKPSDYKAYIDAGYLKEITNAEYLTAYSEASLDAVTVDGKIYGIPYAGDVVGVVYNKTMFEENGWKAPENREEYYALCSEIAKTGVTPTVQGIKDTWTTGQEGMVFMQGLFAEYPDMYDRINAGEAKYTDDFVVDALKEMQEFFAGDGVSREASGLTYDQAASYFATEKAAMMVHGEWIMGPIMMAEPEFEIGVFSLPTNKEGQEHVGAAEIGQYQSIVSSSEHEAAAELFLEYLSSEEGADYFAETMSNMTPVSGVANDRLEMWTGLLDEASLPFYYDMMSPGAQSEFLKQMQLLYSGDTTAEEMAEALQTAEEKKD